MWDRFADWLAMMLVSLVAQACVARTRRVSGIVVVTPRSRPASWASVMSRQRATNGGIDPLPGVTDAAIDSSAAVAVLAAALGDRERPFQGIEDVRRRDLGWRVAPADSRRDCRASRRPGPLRCSFFSSLLTVGRPTCVRSATSAAVSRRSGARPGRRGSPCRSRSVC